VKVVLKREEGTIFQEGGETLFYMRKGGRISAIGELFRYFFQRKVFSKKGKEKKGKRAI